MLSPYELWLVKKFPDDVFSYISKHYKWAEPISYDENIVLSERRFFKKYDDSNILLIGGGPSTNSIDWSNYLKNCDFVWSCNHYFQCEKLKDIKIDLAMIMPGVNLNDERFLSRINRDSSDIGFELHDRWFGSQSLDKFQLMYDKTFFSHSRYFGKVGIGARMIVLGAALYAKSISFVGFDGPIHGHSFQKDKYKLPSGINEGNALDIYQYQYNELWNHINSWQPDTKIVSIDKTNLFHRKVW